MSSCLPSRAWRIQYNSLVRLRFTLARRQIGVTASQLFIGAAAIILLSFFQYLANGLLSNSTPHMPVTSLGIIPRCVADAGVTRPRADGNGSEPGCWTLLYFPDTVLTRSLVNEALNGSGLIEGLDYAPLPGALPIPLPPTAKGWVNATAFSDAGDTATCDTSDVCNNPAEWLSGWCIPCATALDNRTASDVTVNYPGSAQTIVWFLTQTFSKSDLSYSLSWNLSATQSPFNRPAHAAEVKRALDEAILRRAATEAGAPVPALSLSLKDFPRPPPRISGFDIFSQSGAQWTFLPAGLLFFQLLTGIVVEKEEKLRVGMRQMGLLASAYWAAWATYAFTFAVASGLVLLAAGHAAGFPFFTNSAFLAPAALYLVTALAYAAFAVLLSSTVTSGKSAQQLGYSVALISFMFISIVGSGSGILLTLLYSEQLKPWMRAIRGALLIASPALAYTFLLYDIEQRAGSTLDLRAQRIIVGPGFQLSDMSVKRTLSLFGYICDVPAPAFHLGVIFFDFALYTLLGLYLDTVLPGPQGSPAHPLFFLGFRYNTKTAAPAIPPPGEDEGVAEERAAAREARNAATPLAVRIDSLRVVYRKGFSASFYALTGIELSSLWGGAEEGGAGDVVAVADVSLTVARGEIVALLGHNGAGKTTTVSVLTGLVSAAGGAAEVAGADVIAGARLPDALAMGVAPQHDLLFPLLTAREMMLLFCGIKGLPEAKWATEVEEMLTNVNLADVADRMTSTFSGGMKRRLSVALAALGRPPLLIFDEPSTGLDPLARAELLLLLQSLKKSSGLLLTTHSMQEAAALGDRVAIMAAGRVVACGTTVELCRRYGEGYALSLTLRDSAAPAFIAARAAVFARAPSARLSLRDGAAVSFLIPFAAVDKELTPALEWADAGGDGLVREFGVSGPTLEDAFLAVTAASHYGLAEQARGGGGGDSETDTALDDSTTAAGAGADEVETRDVSAYSPLPSTNDMTSLPPPPPRATSRMVKALCVKNMTLIGRARGLCLCQLLTPLLILGLLLTLEELLKVEVGLTAIFITPPIYLPLNVPLADFEGNTVTEGGANGLRRALGAYALASGDAGDGWSNTASFHEILASTAVPPLTSPPLNALRGTSCMQFYLIAIDAAPGINASLLRNAVGALPRGAIPGSPPAYPPNESINASGLLSHVPSFWCPLYNDSVTPAPFFDARPGISPSSIDDELMTDLLVLNSVNSNLLSHAPPCNADPAIACPAFILPDGAWIIEELTTEALLATLQVNSAGSTSYHRPNGVSRPPPPAPSVVLLDAARLGSLDLVTRAYASWAGNASGTTLTMPALSIAASQAELHTQTLSDVVEIIGGVLFVILLSAPLPLFVFIQVTEKELRLDEMQLSMGVQPGPAALVNFGVNAGIYACIVALFWATAGGYMQLRVMAHTSPLLLGATFMGHGLALVTTGALVSAFLWDRQVATVLGVILGIVSPLIATSIMAGVYGRTLPWSLDTTPPPALYAIPILGVQFALARILYLATYSALAFHAPLTSASLDPTTDEVGVAVLALYLAAAGNALAAAYFERTLPRRYGTPSHPLFCLPRGVVKNVDAVIKRITHLIFSRRDGSGEVARVNKTPALSLQTQDSFENKDDNEEEGEGVHTKTKSEFSYASRWAAAAGLSTSAAINSYGRGEDADVTAARKQVDEELWPAAQRDPARIGEAYPVLIRALRKEWELAASSKRTTIGGGGGGGIKGFGDAAPLFCVNGDGFGDVGDAAPLLCVNGDGGDDDVNNNNSNNISSTVTTSTSTSRLGAPYSEAEQRALLSRGTKVAVSDLTLAIPAGACFGLLGENGAGKSSTVAMLQGLHVPTAGSAFVGGHDIRTEQAAVRLSLGVVPQHDVLWPSLTIAEHVLFYARVKGVSAAAEAGAVRAMLRRVGLFDVAARAANALSGGMRRRLSIACAMIGSPRVVLLDELTTGLDPASRRAVWRVVDAARRAQPKAVTLVISHDMNEVEALCSGGGSSCAIMTHGRVRALGTVQHLRELYGDGALLRIGFAGSQETTAGEAADISVGAVEATEAWTVACAKVEALFPKGAGSARVDGHVFQTRAIRSSGESVTVKEAGTACFVLDVGPAASGASVTLAEAFRRLREGAASGGINSWAIEAQTLEAVFARVVRHYKA